MSIQEGPNRPTMGKLTWRFVSGQHLDGVARTDATFIHRGTRPLTVHGRATTWAHLPGYHRTLYRIAASAVTLAILYGYFTERTLTEDTVLAALAASLAFSAWRIHHAYRYARHHKHVVRPLYETLAWIMTGEAVHPHSHADSHKRFIKIPRNYRHPKARVTVNIPPTWEGRPQQVKRIQDLVARRLGGDWDVIPRFDAVPPHLEFFPSPSPPDKLTFADIRSALIAGSESTLIIGKGTHDKLVTIDLDSDAPHVALSIGTGGGKSSLLRLIIAYLRYHGVERIDVVDPKRVSQNWAKGVPGVYIHRTMAEQMAAVSDFRKRMESRYEELDVDDTRTFPRHVLIFEEQNSWMSYAKTYWDDYRAELTSQERSKLPKLNPAISDLAYCLFQGRQAHMNVISVFQSMSANAAGGRDLRENYGAKILARYTPQTWKMLVGTTPVPRSSRINGRGRYTLGDVDHEVQFAFITDAEAREFACAGGEPAGAITTEPPNGNDPLMTVPADNAGADDIPAMTLREMCDANLIPIRYSAARRARTRAGDTFPRGERSPIGTMYNLGDVRAWYESRGKK